MQDTVVSDSICDYLLKAGADFQIPTGVTHLSKVLWGRTAFEFNLTRFIVPNPNGVMNLIIRGAAIMPMTDQEQGYFLFGGGKHSCPGRSSAFVQTLAIGVALVGRFDIRGEDGGLIKVPCMFRSRLGDRRGGRQIH